MNKFIFNSDFSLINSTSDSVILINDVNQRVFEVSNEEYEILREYNNFKDDKDLFFNFKDKFNIGSLEDLNLLITLAKENSLLIEREAKSLRNTLPNNFFAMIVFLFPFIHFELFSVNKLFKVFSLNIKLKYFVPLIFLLSIIYFIILYYMGEMIFYSFSSKLFIMFLFLSFSSVFHEIGHILPYLIMKGKKPRIGFGLLRRFYPVLYTNTPSIYVWNNNKDKLKKIIVTLGGSFFDIVSILILLFIDNMLGVYLIVLRIAQNLNPLIPYSDGYFIFLDLFNKIPLGNLLDLKNDYLNNVSLNSIFKKELVPLIIIYSIRIFFIILYIYFFYFFVLKEIFYTFVIN